MIPILINKVTQGLQVKLLYFEQLIVVVLCYSQEVPYFQNCIVIYIDDS